MTPGSVDVSVVDSDEDGFLYHYTSLEALIGIVNHRTLWASNIKYLNDTSEQTILQNLVRDQILELIAKQSSNAPERWRQSGGLRLPGRNRRAEESFQDRHDLLFGG